MPETVPLPKQIGAGLYMEDGLPCCAVGHVLVSPIRIADRRQFYGKFAAAAYALGVRGRFSVESENDAMTPHQRRLTYGAATLLCGYELSDADDLRAEIDELVAKVREGES